MIVDRPQFNTSKIKAGDLVWISSKARIDGHLELGCIVTEVKPLALTVTYYVEDRESVRTKVIKVEEVVSKEMTLFPINPHKAKVNQHQLDRLREYFIEKGFEWNEHFDHFFNITNIIGFKEDDI